MHSVYRPVFKTTHISGSGSVSLSGKKDGDTPTKESVGIDGEQILSFARPFTGGHQDVPFRKRWIIFWVGDQE